MDLFDLIKALSKRRNTTIEAVAMTAGLTRNSYNSYRSKGNLPRADEAVNMAKALGTSVEYLVTGESAAEWVPPDRIKNIVDDLEMLGDNDLATVRLITHRLVEGVLEGRRASGDG